MLNRNTVRQRQFNSFPKWIFISFFSPIVRFNVINVNCYFVFPFHIGSCLFFGHFQLNAYHCDAFFRPRACEPTIVYAIWYILNSSILFYYMCANVRCFEQYKLPVHSLEFCVCFFIFFFPHSNQNKRNRRSNGKRTKSNTCCLSRLTASFISRFLC